MVVRLLAMVEAWEEDGAGGSGCILVDGGRESFFFTTELSLELRDSCVVNTAAVARISSFAGPMLSLAVRTSCDERGWTARRVSGRAHRAMARRLRQKDLAVVWNRW